MQFRNATCEDLSAMVMDSSHVQKLGGFQRHPIADIAETVRACIEGGNAYVIEDDQIRGSCCVKWFDVSVFGAVTAEIFSLYVGGVTLRESVRFCRYIVDVCKSRGAESILVMEATGSPHRAWKRWGLKEVAVLRVGSVADVLAAMPKV